MIYIPGIFIVSIGLIQLFKLYKNSKRPKIEAIINALIDTHLKQDKNKRFNTQLHAKVSYKVDNKTYKATVLYKDKTKKIGDTITLSHYFTDVKNVEMYVPNAELFMASIITLIGIVALIIGYLVSHYFGWS